MFLIKSVNKSGNSGMLLVWRDKEYGAGISSSANSARRIYGHKDLWTEILLGKGRYLENCGTGIRGLIWRMFLMKQT